MVSGGSVGGSSMGGFKTTVQLAKFANKLAQEESKLWVSWARQLLHRRKKCGCVWGRWVVNMLNVVNIMHSIVNVIHNMFSVSMTVQCHSGRSAIKTSRGNILTNRWWPTINNIFNILNAIRGALYIHMLRYNKGTACYIHVIHVIHVRKRWRWIGNCNISRHCNTQ